LAITSGRTELAAYVGDSVTSRNIKQNPALGGQALRSWGALGADIVVGRAARFMNWAPAHQLLSAARPVLLENATELNRLLKQWNRLITPLEDPFLTDFGVHRWLRNSREESYSDWLDWAVRNLDDPCDVLSLLRIRLPFPVSRLRKHRWQVSREYVTERGHAGHGGRVDLHLVVPNLVSIQVEVKLGDADTADTAKQSGYARSARKHGVPRGSRLCCLITTGADRARYAGNYVPVKWLHVSCMLRCLTVKYVRSDKIAKASLLLGFAGAIEQNLLGYSGVSSSGGAARTVPSAIVDYLREALSAAQEV
jgi:hypothetical protein